MCHIFTHTFTHTYIYIYIYIDTRLIYYSTADICVANDCKYCLAHLANNRAHTYVQHIHTTYNIRDHVCVCMCVCMRVYVCMYACVCVCTHRTRITYYLLE